MSSDICDLAHLHFLNLFLLQTELVARKQGRCTEKASAGKEFHPEILLGFRRMGRAARAPGWAPLHRKIPVLGERSACPPDPRNDLCLMIFPRNALASGPGNAQNSMGLIRLFAEE
jgi:hypothetical protein